jgi:hypothetical protein
MRRNIPRILPAFLLMGIVVMLILLLSNLSVNYSAAQIPPPKSISPFAETFPSTQTAIPQQSSVLLRQRWLKQWAYKTDPKLGKTYENYILKGQNSSRDSIFEALLTQLEDTSHVGTISGEHCLDMLGLPDFWKDGPDGRAVVVYFFQGFEKQRMEVIIEVNARGNVSGFLWNVAGEI